MSSRRESRTRQVPRWLHGPLSLVLGLVVTFPPAIARAQEADDAPSGPQGAVPGGSSGAVIRPAKPEAPPPDVVVVNPVLTKFVDAVYPAEALAQGLQATVVLFVSVDKTGKVTKVDVAEPAGHGFDEAAQAAALAFEFQPATRDGKPVAVRIKYPYHFTLKEVEKPESQKAPPTVGNLGGTVRITGAEEALVGAEVVVFGPDGKEFRTTTDAAGKWALVGLAPGQYRVHATAPGLAPLDATEDVAVGEATDVTYRLAPDVKGKGVEVTVRGERPPREVTRRTISRREMTRIPGTSGDALRSIQSLPGVARPPGLAGLLIVRGSAPQDTTYFVDGANVPIIYHFGGLSSSIPSELLDRIDFYPGNFSARYGQVMGGIVDVALREPNGYCNGPYGKPTDKTGCFHGLVDINLIDTRALVQGQVGSWGFVVGGRRSWFDAWLKPALEALDAGVTSAPVYDDYQFIAETKPTRSSRLSLRFFGSDDKLKFLISNPLAQDPGLGGNLTFGTSFYRAQALYETDLSRDVDLTAMISGGNNAINLGFGPLKFDVNFAGINTRSELTFKVVRGFKLHVGMDFLMGPYHVFVRAPPPPRPGEASPGPFTTQTVFETDDKGMAFRPAWYGEGEIQPTRRSLLVPGVRVDYARDSGHADFAPRLTGRYDLIGGRGEEDRPIEERSLRTTLKGGVGVFYQPPQFQETNPVFGTPGLLSNRSVHYSVGAEQELNRHIEVGLEGYYKNLTHLVSREPTQDGSFAYANAGTGSVLGLETLLKYKPDDRFFGWLAYTLSRSVRTDLPGTPEHLFQFDQSHNLTVLGSYRLGRGWEFGARFRLISGNLATPVARSPQLAALYAADAAAYTALPGAPFSKRLPLFHQLDLRIDKAWQFRAWRLSAYLDVQNVYDYAAREAVNYNYDYTRSTYQTGLPIIPSLGLRGEI
jgi:TonB family protein